jgi:hypothetical protein
MGKLAVLLLGVAACNVAGDARRAETFDADMGPLVDAGPPDARPRQEPIECEPGPVSTKGPNGEYVITTWVAPLGHVDIDRVPRMTAWGCDFLCEPAAICRRCDPVPPLGDCEYTNGEPLDHAAEGTCFPLEVAVRPDGQAVAVCGRAEVHEDAASGMIYKRIDRAQLVYATVD